MRGTLTVPLSELISLSDDVLDQEILSNLLFLIGIRNRVQHHVGSSIDQLVAPKIQANILAFRYTLTIVTHGQITIKNELPYALRFSELSIQQTKELLSGGKVSPSLKTFILELEGSLSPEIRQNPNIKQKSSYKY